MLLLFDGRKLKHYRGNTTPCPLQSLSIGSIVKSLKREAQPQWDTNTPLVSICVILGSLQIIGKTKIVETKSKYITGLWEQLTNTRLADTTPNVGSGSQRDFSITSRGHCLSCPSDRIGWDQEFWAFCWSLPDQRRNGSGYKKAYPLFFFFFF